MPGAKKTEQCMDKLVQIKYKLKKLIQKLSKSSPYRLLQWKELKYYQLIPVGAYRISEDDFKKFIKEIDVK